MARERLQTMTNMAIAIVVDFEQQVLFEADEEGALSMPLPRINCHLNTAIPVKL